MKMTAIKIVGKFIVNFIVIWSIVFWGVVFAVCIIFMDTDFIYSSPDANQNWGKGVLIFLSCLVALGGSFAETTEDLNKL